MCGICGMAGADPVDREVLARMTQALHHRGPDDDGHFVRHYEDGVAVGLGFRRLSIIDLDTGNQPLGNEDGSLQLVFNGEIYNFRELRRDLEARGHRFATNGDAEVIVHLYEDHGPRCVERLNGMFAFALWDEPRRELVLGRDRFGKKPLHYAEVGGSLLFGSELKALLEHPRCPRGLDAAGSPATSRSSTSRRRTRSSRASRSCPAATCSAGTTGRRRSSPTGTSPSTRARRGSAARTTTSRSSAAASGTRFDVAS